MPPQPTTSYRYAGGMCAPSSADGGFGGGALLLPPGVDLYPPGAGPGRGKKGADGSMLRLSPPHSGWCATSGARSTAASLVVRRREDTWKPNSGMGGGNVTGWNLYSFDRLANSCR